MNINSKAAWEAIHRAIYTRIKISEGMRDVIAVCAASYPHPDWARFEAIDYESDVGLLKNWFRDTFWKRPSRFKLRGLYFRLCNPCGEEPNSTSADLSLSGAGQYRRASTGAWIQGERWHYFEDDYAYSTALDALYKLAYYSGENALRNDAEYPLALAYGVLLVRQLLVGRTPDMFPNSADRIGVVVGFSSGDSIRLGEVTEDGLLLLAKSEA